MRSNGQEQLSSKLNIQINSCDFLTVIIEYDLNTWSFYIYFFSFIQNKIVKVAVEHLALLGLSFIINIFLHWEFKASS